MIYAQHLLYYIIVIIITISIQYNIMWQSIVSHKQSYFDLYDLEGLYTNFNGPVINVKT